MTRSASQLCLTNMQLLAAHPLCSMHAGSHIQSGIALKCAMTTVLMPVGMSALTLQAQPALLTHSMAEERVSCCRSSARPDSNRAVACDYIMALMCRGEVQRLEHRSGSGPFSDGCQVPSA